MRNLAWVLDSRLLGTGERHAVIRGARLRTLLRGEPVRVRLLLGGTERRASERSRSLCSREAGRWLASTVGIMLCVPAGGLPRLELARSAALIGTRLLTVVAGARLRLTIAFRAGSRDMRSLRNASGELPGGGLAARRHSPDASVRKGRAIGVAALRELLLRTRIALRAPVRMSQVLAKRAAARAMAGLRTPIGWHGVGWHGVGRHGTGRRDLAGPARTRAGCPSLPLPAWLRPSRAWPRRGGVAEGEGAVLSGRRIALAGPRPGSPALRPGAGTGRAWPGAARGILRAWPGPAVSGRRVARGLARRTWWARRAGHTALGAGPRRPGRHVGGTWSSLAARARAAGIPVARVNRVGLGLYERRVRVLIT
jgi:hypothetical protein